MPRTLPGLLRPALLAVALSSVATAALAGPVMTFTAVFATTGIEDSSESITSSSSFQEAGGRFNFAQTLRDEVVVENGIRTTYHYRDTTYDVEGYWRDAVHVDLDVVAGSDHTAQFHVVGTLVAGQQSRLLLGDLGFEASLSLAGAYRIGEVPEFPDLAQPPAPPVFANISAEPPVPLPGSLSYDPENNAFSATATDAFSASRFLPYHEYSYLAFANEDLLTDRIEFTLAGPGYDRQIRNLGYSELLGTDVAPVPEPGTWMMLLAGVAVLVLARRSRGNRARTTLKST
ncbi:PEP-CTERM sorting domain-containing protein [Massilia sp. METH4]|uniref:PEP-CTERM sorting domain-containing protein n=1 Tax=Massilia sp. METH4 TaxID=3123041 RepID=UPI0030CEFE6E